MRGVYRRPDSNYSAEIQWENVLFSLQSVMHYDIHLGGLSALYLDGHLHYLVLGPRFSVHFYGDAPSWLKRLPCKEEIILHGSKLFGDEKIGLTDTQNSPLVANLQANKWPWPLRFSCPERAILEALDELQDKAGFDSMGKIFESLSTLRPEQLMVMLSACRSVKVRRLFLVFAASHNHAWFKYMDVGKIDIGSGPRAFVKGGRMHPKYLISVPEEYIGDGANA